MSGRKRSLTDSDVVEARAMLARGESQKAIAIHFNVSEGTISSALRGVRYYA